MNEVTEAVLKFADRSWSAVGKLLVVALIIAMSFNFAKVLDISRELFGASSPAGSAASTAAGAAVAKQAIEIDSGWTRLYYVTHSRCVDHLRAISLELNDKDSDLYLVNSDRGIASFKVNGIVVDVRCIRADPHSAVVVYAGGIETAEIKAAVDLVYANINKLQAQSANSARENFVVDYKTQPAHYYYYLDYEETTAAMEDYIDQQLVEKRKYVKNIYTMQETRKIVYRGPFAFLIFHMPLREDDPPAESTASGGTLFVDLMTFGNENAENEYENFEGRKILKFIW